MTTNHPQCPQCRDTLSATAVFTEDGTILTRMFCEECGYATPTVSYGTHEASSAMKPLTAPLWQVEAKEDLPLPHWGAS